ncbi:MULTISPECIES: nitroreductase family protein [Campylobacter]|uniref:nitroreductase family protein n=1 Tax=Campylobacter TaxID=194 RepID=UPI0014700450|nr:MULTISPECIES: nitroreductase family protein [Campylobacter]MBN7287652.1 nitroreductase family protein [Campylobacter curvus]MDU6826477.1 nitroreductase family protein [Campylobacter sp.]
MKEIFHRSSVRNYENKEIEDEKIRRVLKAAMAAPSAGNQRPWEFYVVKDKILLQALSKLSQYSDCLKDAPVGIVICYNNEGCKYQECAPFDASCAAQNLWLEADSLGLGAVWLGIAPYEKRMQEAREILNLPPNLSVLCIMAIGYPKTAHEQKERFDESKIHYIGKEQA